MEYLYCATASSDRWPESGYSEQACIVGELGKRVVDSGAFLQGGGEWRESVVVYPNPCNPRAMVRYVVAEEGEVKVSLYDLCGREVARLAEGPHRAGEHQVKLEGRALSTGAYLVRMVHGGRALSAKVLVVR
ncbi:MAG: T9SS type A sorting domain-containing protein [Calditrichaeota bacterium]|nr:T9SS type A sorting domain-containing protein [Calditrichota bacterium]